MSYLFLMTLGGSVMLVGCLVWERLFEKSMTQHMGYAAFITVLLTFLVPWVWIKGIYRFVLFAFWDESVIGDAKGLVNIADLKTQESAYRTEDYRVLVIFAVIWFIGAFAIMIVKTFRYIHMRRGLYGLSIKCGDENLDETVERLQKELRCRRKPKVVWTRVNNKTFTLGAICPIIFLQKDYADGELYWILKHEMTHIVRGDLLIKMLLEFASCLYWFNPFIYVLTHRLEFMSEASCDERVLKGCDEKEREMCIELLDKNKDGNRVEIPFCSALDEGSKDIDKRIKLLKQARKIKGKKKLFVISAFVFLVFIDSLIVFAYPKVQHVELVITEAAREAVDGNNFWACDFGEEGYSVVANAILYDEQVVDEKGQIFQMPSPETNSSCAVHDIISGYYQKHIVNEDGGCVVETYKCTKCTICDTVWVGELYTKNLKDACTH